MAQTRKIAVLRARNMLNSAFILPILITRVIDRPFPKSNDIYALAREGGFDVTYADLTIAEGQSMEDAIDGAYQNTINDRPVFVDIETGRLFVVRGHTDLGEEFIAQEGNLTEAFGSTILSDRPDVTHSVMFRSRSPIYGTNALRSAVPGMNIADAKSVVCGGGTVNMKACDVVAVLLAAMNLSARRHRDITDGKITDEFGATPTSQIIEGFVAI